MQSLRNTKMQNHVDFSLKTTIKEDFFNINLGYMPLTNIDNYNKTMNNSYLYNISKSLLIIQTILLREPFSNQSAFAPLNQTMRLNFDFIDSTRTSYTLTKVIKLPNLKC